MSILGPNQPPAYCSMNSSGTSTCRGHQAGSWGTVTLSFSTQVTQNGVIEASDVNLLITNAESALATINSWLSNNASTGGTWTAISQKGPAGSVVVSKYKINAGDVNNWHTDVANGANQNYPVGVNYNRYSGTAGSAGVTADSVAQKGSIRITTFQDLYSNYQAMVRDCVCNSDCSCNAVCNCHNDCICNYSDRRLKENIVLLDKQNGLNIYSFTYIWDKFTKYTGVMAQELLGTCYESALAQDSAGYYMVNYSALPVEFGINTAKNLG